MPRTWLVTGASTGFGREFVSQLLARGETVVATARNVQDISEFSERYGERCLATALDVTSTGQITEVVTASCRRFGGIDVLINNAGFGYRSAIEEGEDDQIRALFETNVFGLMAVTRAVLPVMRSRGQGIIVNMSSIGGRSVPPGSGYYGATKFAVEGFSDALRKEVGPLGIRVLVVEPSAFRTDFARRSLRQSESEIAAYADTAGARRRPAAGPVPLEPGDPVRAVATVIQAIESPAMPFRLLLGREAFRRARLTLDEQMHELSIWQHQAESADYDSAADGSGRHHD